MVCVHLLEAVYLKSRNKLHGWLHGFYHLQVLEVPRG